MKLPIYISIALLIISGFYGHLRATDDICQVPQHYLNEAIDVFYETTRPNDTDDEIWQTFISSVQEVVMDYLVTCADIQGSAEAYHTALELLVNDEDNQLMRDSSEPMKLFIERLDVNLDDMDEVKVKIALVESYWRVEDSNFEFLYHVADEQWEMLTLWPPHSLTAQATNEDLPESLNVFSTSQFITIMMHPQADTLGRSYMSIVFRPGLMDFYLDGFMLFRWDEWQSELLVFEEGVCISQEPWRVGENGEIIITTNSSVPWQGCTVRPMGQIIIEDALMPLPETP